MADLLDQLTSARTAATDDHLDKPRGAQLFDRGENCVRRKGTRRRHKTEEKLVHGMFIWTELR